MTPDTWHLFPRHLEQKINILLESAEPNTIKAYQLFKTCKSENLWKNSFELFQVHLTDFFSMPKAERVKSYFDQFLERPMNRAIYDEFELNFRTAHVNSQSITEIAEWTHYTLENNSTAASIVSSIEVLTKTLQYITSPPPFEKSHDIEFEDFCIAWKKTVFALFGKKYDHELNEILKEVRQLNRLLRDAESTKQKKIITSSIYLTQTEINWTISVQSAAFEYSNIPQFPLSRGPEKDRLIHLQRASALFNIILTTDNLTLKQHQEAVRNTVLHYCSSLLKDKAS